jgi:formate/nitrite transporter FocA (FNT family)
MGEQNEHSGATLDYRNIIERTMENALKEMSRPSKGMFLSGFSAGLNLSFGALFMIATLALSGGFESALAKQTALGAVSSLPFLFVMIGQTELFTAHTTMAILPVLDGRASLGDLGRVWSLIYVSNLLGCAVFAGLVVAIGGPMWSVDSATFGSLAEALLSVPWWTVLLSATVAGWLMGLATWLLAASRDTVSRVLLVLLITAMIGFGPFHHSILGTTEVLIGMFAGQGVTVADFAYFLVWTTLGNVVGGVFFVGLFNYGHAALAGEQQDVDFETGTVDES